MATYGNRFLADTGALEEQASQLGLTTEQYGMIREETGHAPGAWWLSPRRVSIARWQAMPSPIGYVPR